MYHKQAPIPVYFKHYRSIAAQTFLIISPPLPQAFQVFKCFLFTHHTSQRYYNQYGKEDSNTNLSNRKETDVICPEEVDMAPP